MPQLRRKLLERPAIFGIKIGNGAFPGKSRNIYCELRKKGIALPVFYIEYKPDADLMGVCDLLHGFRKDYHCKKLIQIHRKVKNYFELLFTCTINATY